MARVDFYVLAQVDERARHMLACKLAEKAWRLENTVYIHAKDPGDAKRLPNLSRGRYTWWRHQPGEDVFTYDPGTAGKFRVWKFYFLDSKLRFKYIVKSF